MIRIFTLLFCYTLNIISANTQTLTVEIPQGHFNIDVANELIVSRIDQIESYTNLENYEEVILILGQTTYTFSATPASLVYSTSYLVTDQDNFFTLYFTSLPIVSVAVNTEILDEPKVPAFLTYADDTQLLVSSVGIELRGGSSLSHPKKTYDLEFWEDPSGAYNKAVQFGNMREDDDWILDGLYNEPLRMRSHLAHKLWLEMHTPYYQDDEPAAKAGADVAFVELFINGAYKGLYNLSEQVDRKLLKIKKFTTETRGELYKGVTWGGGTTFSSLPDYDNNSRLWGGYDFKYPKVTDIATDWTNIYNLIDFAINSSNNELSENMWSYFQQENYIDYFIFLNFLRASDNTGKNIFLTKYKQGEPYFLVPWDLDGVLGTNWQGHQDPVTIYPTRNVFNNRVIDLNIDNYATVIENRWVDLRENILNTEHWQNKIEAQYQFFTTNKIYERESIVFPNYDFDDEDLAYMQNWLNGRLAFLDEYFDDQMTALSSDNPENIVFLYPNPGRDKIYIKNIAFLENHSYELFNTIGKCIQKGEITNNFIPVTSLSPGRYTIVLDKVAHQLLVE